MRTSILITDFDGTIAGTEFYELVVPDLLGDDPPDYWASHLEGRMSHFEAMRAVFSHIRCDEPVLRRIVARMDPDPKLGPATGRLGQAGWDVEIVSAGCRWYIDQILEMAGVDVPVHASPGRFSPTEGLVMELPLDSPYCSPETGIDKTAVVKDVVSRYQRVAYAGDGPTDLEPALLIPPEHRFASRWLADELRSRRIPFHPFSRWSEIAETLLVEP